MVKPDKLKNYFYFENNGIVYKIATLNDSDGCGVHHVYYETEKKELEPKQKYYDACHNLKEAETAGTYEVYKSSNLDNEKNAIVFPNISITYSAKEGVTYPDNFWSEGTEQNTIYYYFQELVKDGDFITYNENQENEQDERSVNTLRGLLRGAVGDETDTTSSPEETTIAPEGTAEETTETPTIHIEPTPDEETTESPESTVEIPEATMAAAEPTLQVIANHDGQSTPLLTLYSNGSGMNGSTPIIPEQNKITFVKEANYESLLFETIESGSFGNETRKYSGNNTGNPEARGNFMLIDLVTENNKNVVGVSQFISTVIVDSTTTYINFTIDITGDEPTEEPPTEEPHGIPTFVINPDCDHDDDGNKDKSYGELISNSVKKEIGNLAKNGFSYEYILKSLPVWAKTQAGNTITIKNYEVIVDSVVFPEDMEAFDTEAIQTQGYETLNKKAYDYSNKLVSDFYPGMMLQEDFEIINEENIEPADKTEE